MQYHALALAVNGSDVDLVGLEGAPLHAAVAAEPRIHGHRLSDRAFGSRASGGRRRFVLLSAARAATQAMGLFWTLMRLPRPEVMLVQVPPASPSLAVSWIAARLRGARLVVDWHNLAHTVLAVRLGDSHRAVRALRRSERRWSRRADAHLTVSRALADWLQREYGIPATVIYDRPPRAFGRPDAAAAAALREKLARELTLGSHATALVVAPTSWTPDEDFDLLIEALERAERELRTNTASGAGAASSGTAAAPAAAGPALALILTGRGSMRETFEKRIARRDLKHIAVRTAWIDPADYPTLVGMADLGLCLHQSSSGLDLPMKLADFRGAGVPVCTFDYAPVLGEAMVGGQQGITFTDPGQLAKVLVQVATGRVPADAPLARSRAWLAANPVERWEDQWAETAAPVINAR
jgi:beta-1,4-mannosyltransferase